MVGDILVRVPKKDFSCSGGGSFLGINLKED